MRSVRPACKIRVVELCGLKKAKRLKKKICELCEFLRDLRVKIFT
jgi:hypothetical protein